MSNQQLSCKFIMVGESGVGKTAIASRFCEGKFDPNQPHTVGVEFFSRVVKVGTTPMRLQIWDTAGQERFRAITKAYFRSTAAIFMVYDVTKRCTFSEMGHWIENAHSLTPSTSLKIMIGNKVDLKDEREVTSEEAEQLANQYGIKYYETSAVSGERLTDAFIDSASNLLERVNNGEIVVNDPNAGVRTTSINTGKAHVDQEKTSKCC